MIRPTKVYWRAQGKPRFSVKKGWRRKKKKAIGGLKESDPLIIFFPPSGLFSCSKSKKKVGEENSSLWVHGAQCAAFFLTASSNSETANNPVCRSYLLVARNKTLLEPSQPGSASRQRNSCGESRRVKPFLPRPLSVVLCPLCGMIISYWPAWCLTMDSISALQRRKRLPSLCQTDTI